MGARECQLNAAAQADTMDRSDGRDWQRLDIHEDRLPEPDLLLGVRGILEFSDLIHVGTGDERIRFAAADYHRFDPAFSTCRAGAIEGLREAPHDGLGENVQAAFGIVERDPPYTVGVDLESR